MAGPNSYKQALQEALDSIKAIEDRLRWLDKKIIETSKLAQEKLALPTQKTPKSVENMIKEQQKLIEQLRKNASETEKLENKKTQAVKKAANAQEQEIKQAIALAKERVAAEKAAAAQEAAARKKREAQIKRESDLREKLRRDQDKEESQRFKNMAKATREERRAMREREKAIKKTADTREHFYQQQVKQEERNFKQLAKATQIEKQERKKREAAVKKEAETKSWFQKQKEKWQEWNFTQLRRATQIEKREMKEREQAVKRESDFRLRMERQKQQEINRRIAAQRRAAAADAHQRVNQAALAKAADLEAKAQSKLAGAYQNVIAKRDQAKKRLRDLLAAEKASTAEIKKAQREYDKYAAKVNKANAATANFANNSLRGLVQGMRNLALAFGWTGGLYIFADMVRRGFKLARQLDSISFAMETVITDANELARTEAFLTRITEQYGAELVTTTNRYIKFMAAAKQSNVTLEDTEKIFGTMTKAAGALGLSAEELQGIYLALEQMLSKGKITTEELRRQLGERLPGAFGIMADAVGVSVEELDGMLRKGEVLAGEVLPKFADQVEIAFGLDKIDRVENLNAATTRLSNAWVTLVRNITNSEGPVSKALISMINGIKGAVDMINVLNRTLESTTEVGRSMGRAEIMDKIKKDVEEMGGSMKEAAENRLPQLQRELQAYSVKMAKVQKELAGKDPGAFNWINPIKGMYDAINGFVNENKLNTLNQMTAKYREMVNAAREAAGLKPFDFFAGPDTFNTQNLDHVTAILKNLEESLEKLKKKKEEVAGTDSFTPEQEVKLDREIKKVEGLIVKYGQLRKAAMRDQDGWSFDVEGRVELSADTAQYGTLLYWQEKLKDAQEKYKHSTLETKDAIAAKMALYEKEIALWERGNEALEKRPKVEPLFEMNVETKPEEGSIAAWESFISATRKYQEVLSHTSEEYKALEKHIQMAERAIKTLKGEFEVTDYLKGPEDLEGLQELLNSKIPEAMEQLSAQTGTSMEDLMREFKSWYEWDYENFLEFRNKKIEAEKEQAETMKELRGELADSLIDVGQSILDAQVEQVNKEIELNQEKYARILDNKELTEQQRAAIEAERDRKEAELEKRRRERQKEAFLFNKAIAVAEAIINVKKAITEAGVTTPEAILRAIIGAMHVAAIVAQTIPKFEKGTDDAPEGWALVDEKTPEVHTDKHGNVKSWGLEKPNYRYLQKGDKIHTSHDEYFKTMNTENQMQQAIWQINMNSASKDLSSKKTDSALLNSIWKLEKSNKEVWQEVKKIAGRPIHVNNTVEIKDDRPY